VAEIAVLSAAFVARQVRAVSRERQEVGHAYSVQGPTAIAVGWFTRGCDPHPAHRDSGGVPLHIHARAPLVQGLREIAEEIRMGRGSSLKRVSTKSAWYGARAWDNRYRYLFLKSVEVALELAIGLGRYQQRWLLFRATRDAFEARGPALCGECRMLRDGP
jgi:hypothetical protein